MSGQHVVYGFLRPLTRWMRPEHRITIVHYAGETPPPEILELGVESVCLPNSLRHWAKRTLWEATQLASVVRRVRADVVLTVSGAFNIGCPVPQVTLCQNPWCYIPEAHRNWQDRLKARLQRMGYAKAFRHSAMMIYISRHLRELYAQDNPGVNEQSFAVAWVGLNEDTFASAEHLRHVEREPWSILSVSAMASWKGAETLVEAVRLLRVRSVPATLKLVGPWPDAAYEKRIRDQIQSSQLTDSITILGKVSDDELHRLYATSQAFCLMSTCESFGIPAAEAKCFGTPVVSTNCCAISEICDTAGLFGPANDPVWTADSLQKLLTDQSAWKQLSVNARIRASQLRWEQCAQSFHRIPKIAETDSRVVTS